ncbi:hypothetical protein [Streptomyces sp. H27-D2]|uniref:hypothetical protein n=1 Tax=Streptomyces sp. H27-D2 TaxID=3046304 RepID=UPI002DBB00B7|nr:hypothetical protein [Streptomyces sp. H27-D2]MEC4018457.1 hypothetical protein [Streptomyces sp. H27-D2]
MSSTHEHSSEPAYAPEPGETVRDDRGTGRVGTVMAKLGPYYQLRPIGGGREWDAPPENVHPISQAEILSARLRAANDRSRYGGCR